MNNRTTITAGVVAVVLLSFLYGTLSIRNGWPPGPSLDNVYRRWFGEPSPGPVVSRSTNAIPAYVAEDPEFTQIDPVYRETDVAKLIQIRTGADAERVRTQLVAAVWGSAGLPSRQPDVVQPATDARYKDIESLVRLDRVIVRMEFGLESHVFLFHPRTSNGRLVIYHQGHDGDFHIGKKTIVALVDKGYTVAAFCMPLMGLNNRPVFQSDRLGRVKLVWHEDLKFLRPEHGHPVKFFLEPVIVTLNLLCERRGFRDVTMLGYSGGGWTTTLVAAVDPRVRLSFPVAGSYPIYLRSESPRDRGDWEQTVPEIYTVANYLELYILGGWGPGRRQLQVINQYDSCCFAGLKWQTYNGEVTRRVKTLGAGSWDLFLDPTHRNHCISDAALARILEEMNVPPR